MVSHDSKISNGWPARLEAAVVLTNLVATYVVEGWKMVGVLSVSIFLAYTFGHLLRMSVESAQTAVENRYSYCLEKFWVLHTGLSVAAILYTTVIALLCWYFPTLPSNIPVLVMVAMMGAQSHWWQRAFPRE